MWTNCSYSYIVEKLGQTTIAHSQLSLQQIHGFLLSLVGKGILTRPTNHVPETSHCFCLSPSPPTQNFLTKVNWNLEPHFLIGWLDIALSNLINTINFFNDIIIIMITFNIQLAFQQPRPVPVGRSCKAIDIFILIMSRMH